MEVPSLGKYRATNKAHLFCIESTNEAIINHAPIGDRYLLIFRLWGQTHAAGV